MIPTKHYERGRFMTQNWFVIDSDGNAENIDRATSDFWNKFDYKADDSNWPDFTQLVVNATVENVVKALQTVAITDGLDCIDITDEPEKWETSLCVARNGKALCLAEPRRDIDDRWLHAGVAEKLAGMLACQAAFFGHDSSVGLIHVGTFDLGAPQTLWCDSTLPGPSFARTYERNGTCTEEDPREYALSALDMPSTSPLLDRYAYVEHVLRPFEMTEGVRPELGGLEVIRVLRIR